MNEECKKNIEQERKYLNLSEETQKYILLYEKNKSNITKLIIFLTEHILI